ncbi:hypothetical protein [Streptomyces sp. PA5.6]|uniref:hypothetical protein n=1 Tax=Streptomyces sp. PA5.6 TaxID=3035651 RepID=UPI003904CC62
MCEARRALAGGRDVRAELAFLLATARELLEAAAFMEPAPEDVQVPYLPSPYIEQDTTPARGALADAAYRAVQAAQLLVMATETRDFSYLA